MIYGFMESEFYKSNYMVTLSPAQMFVNHLAKFERRNYNEDRIKSGGFLE